MRRRPLLLAVAALALGGCGGDDEDDPPRTPTTPAATERETPTRDAGREPVRTDGSPRVSTFAAGLDVPWELAFLPDGRALVTERPGRVRLLNREGRLRSLPAAEVEVSALAEGGLLGMAIDPDFASNRYLYLYRTTSSGNEVARYRLEGERLEQDAVILRGIAAAAIHDGGRIRFGPDERLYVSTGDAGQDSLAQDPGSLNGKILRLDRRHYRGDAPRRPQVFTLGHRNPQGFDWVPGTRRMVENEHGPDGDDEVNLLRRGANYGWPNLRGEATRSGFTAPVAVYETSIAPSGATFVSLPGSEWTGDYLIGALVGEQIRRVRIRDGRVTTDEALFEGEFGRVRTVVEGPDGAIYALTNNRDGRGTPREDDDRILRIVPPAG